VETVGGTRACPGIVSLIAACKNPGFIDPPTVLIVAEVPIIKQLALA
jgi:hypothetical protein